MYIGCLMHAAPDLHEPPLIKLDLSAVREWLTTFLPIPEVTNDYYEFGSNLHSAATLK